MNKRLLTAGIFFLISLSLLAQKKEEKKLIKESIETNDKLLEEYFEKEMVDSIAGMFSPNCHFSMEHSEIVESREKVQQYLKNDLKGNKKISKYRLDPGEIKIYDDIVLEIGTNKVEYTILPDKKLIVREYNYMFVWKKSKDNGYHLRAAIWNLPKDPCE